MKLTLFTIFLPHTYFISLTLTKNTESVENSKLRLTGIL